MIRLLSTDFDGTLVSHFARPPVAPELFTLLRELQKDGVRWAINTGRELDHIVAGLQEFSFPIEPDFVLTSERDVFRKVAAGQGWEPFGDWNERCGRAHDDLFAQAQPLLKRILDFIKSETRAQTIYEGSRPVGLIAENEVEMDRIVAFVEIAREEMRVFSYQRNTEYLRFCHADYSKGAALGELGRLLGISRDETFAAGDHHNDIPMLDGVFARWIACPSNSADAVKETVRAANGYVAREAASRGVTEALHYFLSRQTLAATT